MKIKSLLITLLTLTSLCARAQEGGVTGKVVSRMGRVPIEGASVALMSDDGQQTTTAEDGTFTFNNVAPGLWRIAVEAVDFLDTEVSVRVDNTMRNIDLVTMTADVAFQELDDASLTEFDMESANDAQSMPVVLGSSRDVFDDIAGYNFGAMRFRQRGYDTGLADVYLNGVYFNDALTGYSPWSLWGGLNEATRNQDVTGPANISDYGVGGVNGTTNINARASQMRKGFRSSIVNASGQYRLRVMLSYASGEDDKGWSYALSASTRQGGNDWVDGVSYNAWSYFASVEKRLGACHRLAFTFLGAPTIRGVQSAATQEVYDLLGDNYYNPNWGYQGSDKRNARVRDNHEPVAMLNYYWTPNPLTTLSAALSYRFGRNGYSALDWYNAADPRPDYYRYLPSYADAGSTVWHELVEGWKTDNDIRQIDWDNIYRVNRSTRPDEPSYNPLTGDKYTGYRIGETFRRGTYAIEDRRTDQSDLNAKLQLSHRIHDYATLNIGADMRRNDTHYYKKLKDLLGADYWVDVDGFAEREHRPGSDATQSDLNNPDRLVKEGDNYGYGYKAHVRSGKLWATYEYGKGMFEAYAGAEAGYTKFWREGMLRKGLFPDNSYGDSRKKDFFTYTGKLGFTYRLSGFSTISGNAAYMERAPYFNQAFLSPRTRNTLASGLTTEKILSGDINYNLRMRQLQVRASLYYTRIEDRTDLISFYDETASTNGTSEPGFTNYSMYGIDQVHRGFELGIQVPVFKGLTASGAVSYGIYKYSNNPLVTQVRDSSDDVIVEGESVRWKDYRVGGTPQTAVGIELNYRTESYWFFSLDANYFDRMYLDLNPLRRSDRALAGLTADARQVLARQEKFPDVVLLNANVGKSWYINRKYNFGFNLQVRNLLNKQDIKTGGYEQMRLRANSDGTGYEAFGSKYFYLFGTNYYLNLYLRF